MSARLTIVDALEGINGGRSHNERPMAGETTFTSLQLILRGRLAIAATLE